MMWINNNTNKSRLFLALGGILLLVSLLIPHETALGIQSLFLGLSLFLFSLSIYYIYRDRSDDETKKIKKIAIIASGILLLILLVGSIFLFMYVKSIMSQ